MYKCILAMSIIASLVCDLWGMEEEKKENSLGSFRVRPRFLIIGENPEHVSIFSARAECSRPTYQLKSNTINFVEDTWCMGNKLQRITYTEKRNIQEYDVIQEYNVILENGDNIYTMALGTKCIYGSVKRSKKFDLLDDNEAQKYFDAFKALYTEHQSK